MAGQFTRRAAGDLDQLQPPYFFRRFSFRIKALCKSYLIYLIVILLKHVLIDYMTENNSLEILKEIKKKFRNPKQVNAVFINAENKEISISETFQDFYDFYIFRNSKQKEGYSLKSCDIIPAYRKRIETSENVSKLVLTFVINNCELSPESQTPIKDIYNLFAAENPGISQTFFTKILLKHFPAITRKQKRNGSENPIQIFIGICLKKD